MKFETLVKIIVKILGTESFFIDHEYAHGVYCYKLTACIDTYPPGGYPIAQIIKAENVLDLITKTIEAKENSK